MHSDHSRTKKKRNCSARRKSTCREYGILPNDICDLWRDVLDTFVKALLEAEDEEWEEPKKAVKKLRMLKNLTGEEVMPSPEGAIHFLMIS